LRWRLLKVGYMAQWKLTPVYSLFERLQPAHARLDESCEWAAATAKHLFDLVRTRRFRTGVPHC
jgi:hypothetical protein